MSIYSYKKQTTEFNLNWIQCKSRETLRGGVLNCHFWQPFQRANICRETVWKEHLYYWNCLCKQKANAKNDWRLKNKNRSWLQIFLFKTSDNHSVRLLSTALEGKNDLLSGSKKRKTICDKIHYYGTIPKRYSNWICRVAVIDDRAGPYNLDCKSSACYFYFHILFDLLDVVACINSILLFKVKRQNQLTLDDYKIVNAKY